MQPANDNGGGQVVISGHRTAIERAIEIAKTKGVRRAMLLPVSAPFHCALMAPAADAMAEALEKTPPDAPMRAAGRQCLGQTRIRSWANPRPAGTAGHRHGPLARMRRGDDRRWASISFIELGAGKVLTGLIKRIAPDASGIAAGTPAEIEAVLKSL